MPSSLSIRGLFFNRPECKSGLAQIGIDAEEVIEPDQLQGLGNDALETAELHIATGRLHPLAQHQQRPQSGAGDVFELRTVDDQLVEAVRDHRLDVIRENLGIVTIDAAVGDEYEDILIDFVGYEFHGTGGYPPG